jgi:hypothetical protein
MVPLSFTLTVKRPEKHGGGHSSPLLLLPLFLLPLFLLPLFLLPLVPFE